MELYHQRIEGTTKAIAQFKAEQEKLILGSANAKSSTQQSSASRTNQNISAVATESSGDAVLINRAINVDVIIMPHCRAAKAHQKLWPQALIANRSTSCAEVGLIESHGSLWKIIPCSESSIGSRVILQCSEKGETPRYLNADMELVDMKVDAAVWQMRPTTSNCAAPASEEEGRGVVVVFELVDAAAPVASAPVSGSARQLLVCETSRELRSYSELFVEPVALTHKAGTFSSAYASTAAASALLVDLAQSETQEQQQQEEGDEEGAHPTFRSCEWEVLPEAWLGGIGGELDFLEGHIN